MSLSQSRIIRLNVNASTDGVYKLNMLEIKGIPQIFDIWLKDAYKKDSLDMRHNNTYAFDVIKSDTNTYGSKRFSLVIRQNPALGLHLLDFTAVKTNKGVQVSWLTENEQNYTNFTVERSTDNGKTFVVLNGFLSTASGTYGYLDKNPLIAVNEYRLKLGDINGKITYSNVVSVRYSGDDKKDNALSIYPNPTTGMVNLSIAQNNGLPYNLSALQTIGIVPGLVSPKSTGPLSYDVKVISITGAIVRTARSSQPSWHDNLSGLQPGTYIIQVVNTADQSLVGKSTLVKL